MRRTIAVVSAGLSQPSTTRLLADRLATATDRALRLHGEEGAMRVAYGPGLAERVAAIASEGERYGIGTFCSAALDDLVEAAVTRPGWSASAIPPAPPATGRTWPSARTTPARPMPWPRAGARRGRS